MSRDRVLTAVIGLAFACSLAAIVYYGSHGETLAYGDARARLDIARRVFDNQQPGLVQLGTFWLPLHMLLMVPLVLIEPLWHTGAAGIALSALSYMGSSAFVYLAVRWATGSRFGAAVAALLMLANPNLLYLQSTPMSEPLFLLLYCAGLCCLVHWAGSGSAFYLVTAGLLVGLSALVRYDGWFTVVACLVAVLLIAWRRHESGAATRSFLLAFGVIGLQGIAGFLLYNLVFFANPLAFASGPGSASMSYRDFSAGSGFVTQGNLLHAFQAYTWTVVDNVGAVSFVLGCIALTYAVWRNRLSPVGIALYAFASAYLFNVVSLFLGQSALSNEHVLPGHSLFNVRYGIVALPAVAVFIGLLAATRPKPLRIAVALVALTGVATLYLEHAPITLVEPAQPSAEGDVKAAREYLKSHYDHGLVLIDFRVSDADAFYTGLPMDRFLHQGVRGKQHIFEKAAGNLPQTVGLPSQYVRWIYVRVDSDLFKQLSATPDFYNNFACVYGSNMARVYEVSGLGTEPSPGCDPAAEPHSLEAAPAPPRLPLPPPLTQSAVAPQAQATPPTAGTAGPLPTEPPRVQAGFAPAAVPQASVTTRIPPSQPTQAAVSTRPPSDGNSSAR